MELLSVFTKTGEMSNEEIKHHADNDLDSCWRYKVSLKSDFADITIREIQDAIRRIQNDIIDLKNVR